MTRSLVKSPSRTVAVIALSFKEFLVVSFDGVPLTALAVVFAVTKIKTIMDLAAVSTAKNAASMQAYGGAVGAVGGKLPGLVTGLGKVATAWVALNALHTVIDGWQGDAANVDAIMLKECSVLGGRDRLDELRRNVVKSDGLSPTVALGRDGVEYLWLEESLLDLLVCVAIADRRHRLAVL